MAADEVRVPLGAPSPGLAVAAGASPASPGAPGQEAERGSGLGASPPESPGAERRAELGADEEQPVPYPALAATVFFCLGQTTRPRSWCLRLVCNPYPSRAAGCGDPVRDTRSACVPARPRSLVPAGAGRAGAHSRDAVAARLREGWPGPRPGGRRGISPLEGVPPGQSQPRTGGRGRAAARLGGERGRQRRLHLPERFVGCDVDSFH